MSASVAWGAIRFLYETKKAKVIVEYFKAMKDGKDPAQAQEVAFGKGFDFGKFEKDFRAWIGQVGAAAAVQK